MTFLSLQPLSAALLPAALALDQRCFGGLWTLDGYQRELESPNSELLVLVQELAVSDQELAVNGQRSAVSSESAGEQANLNTIKTLLAPSPSPPLTPLLGLGCYWAILEEAHITMLAIDPTYQRQGLGQALLHALITSAHQRGLERATLEVRVSNRPAIALYQKFDFCEAGRRQRYYPDDGEDALVLWRGGLQAPDFSKHLTSWQQQICERLHHAGWQLHWGGDRSTD